MRPPTGGNRNVDDSKTGTRRKRLRGMVTQLRGSIVLATRRVKRCSRHMRVSMRKLNYRQRQLEQQALLWLGQQSYWVPKLIYCGAVTSLTVSTGNDPRTAAATSLGPRSIDRLWPRASHCEEAAPQAGPERERPPLLLCGSPRRLPDG